MQFVVNGLIAGSVTALLAIAFQLVYLPTRVFFVALAGIYTLAPFIAGAVLDANGGWTIAVAAAIVVCVAVSVLCEFLNHAPLARRDSSEGIQLIASLGTYIVLVQVIVMIWGSNPKTLRVGIDSVSSFGGAVITQSQWIMAGVSAALIGSFAALLLRSEIGIRLRALADNPAQFGLLGYDVDRYRLLAFAISGVFAAASALLTTYDFGFDPYIGLQAVLLAVVAVILGGRGSFAGSVVAALLLGVLRSTVVWTLSPRWQEAVTFSLLAIVLLLRPRGLLGRAQRIEATL